MNFAEASVVFASVRVVAVFKLKVLLLHFMLMLNMLQMYLKL